MDERDRRILEILTKDSSTPNVKIARALKVSEASVRKRVAKLRADGVIRRFTVELEESLGVGAISLVAVDPAVPTKVVAHEIMKLEGVERVYEVTGNFDLAVIFYAESAEKLNDTLDKIRHLKHVQNTDTRMILKKW
ncbi:MAG: Lrp/AsnC family transcriptional regulator [Candidatus Micrarchaeota archaeon]